eukprot:g9291.t1
MLSKTKKDKSRSRFLIVFILLTVSIWLMWLISHRPSISQNQHGLDNTRDHQSPSKQCVDELMLTHEDLSDWMSGEDSDNSIESLFSELPYSDDFVLDMRQRSRFGYVAGLHEVKKMLQKMHGTAKGLKLVVSEIYIEHESPKKVIVRFEEHQEVAGKLQSLIYSRIYCRRKVDQPTEVEFYIQEESDSPLV